MLRRDDDGVDGHGMAVLVDDGDLSLAVGAEPFHAGTTAVGQSSGDPVREEYRHRHQLLRLVRRVAEHHALVAGATGVYPLGYVGRLLVDGADDGAGLVIEAVRGIGVADALHGVAYE